MLPERELLELLLIYMDLEGIPWRWGLRIISRINLIWGFLIPSKRKEWNKFRELYSHSRGDKPEGVGKEKIAKWCEDKLVSRDDSSFELVKKWCVIDSREVHVKAMAEGRKTIPVSGENVTQAWQSAWDSYHAGKASSKLRIEDASFVGEEKEANTTGGPALQKWCQSKSSKLMYEYLGESDGYEKYHAWCTKE
ncbi:hypothetical protein HF1_05300 [Mycoplasma haemofelis str. Langford 1]|uniref:Uncharacterized protein n=1 Tax=Mycoplasma haemofelis (strain Langford 1) TaxID=941640 RepID=E8ZHB7_MYCHL|nr:hypothetical protein HF1_05300 [Mycoplasma haemofelis str. Langford 1]